MHEFHMVLQVRYSVHVVYHFMCALVLGSCVGAVVGKVARWHRVLWQRCCGL